MTTTERQQEALSRARGNLTMSNYPAIFEGFLAKGIPEEDIKPRVNVFTYEAWRALGRQVRKGEHGVKVHTFQEGMRPSDNPDDVNEDGTVKMRPYRRPWMTTVFHVSQTDARNGG